MSNFPLSPHACQFIQHHFEINPLSWLTPHLNPPLTSPQAAGGGQGQGELLCHVVVTHTLTPRPSILLHFDTTVDSLLDVATVGQKQINSNYSTTSSSSYLEDLVVAFSSYWYSSSLKQPSSSSSSSGESQGSLGQQQESKKTIWVLGIWWCFVYFGVCHPIPVLLLVLLFSPSWKEQARSSLTSLVRSPVQNRYLYLHLHLHLLTYAVLCWTYI